MALEQFHFTRSTGDKVAVPLLKDSLSMRKMQKLQKQYKDDGQELSEKVMEAVLGKKLTDEILGYASGGSSGVGVGGKHRPA